MIEVASDNHIDTECTKISKADLKTGIWRTIEEFADDVDSSFYGDWDCSAYWACEHGGNKYSGDRVDVDDMVESKPHWATHVYWYSK